jgi:hypothetical protein
MVVLIIIAGVAVSAVTVAFGTRLVFPLQCRSAYYQPPNVSETVPSELLSIPVEITIAGVSGNLSYPDSYIAEIMLYVNTKWKENANITFHVVSIQRIPIDKDPSLSQNDVVALQAFARNVIGARYGDEVIDFIIIDSFRDVKEGGKAIPQDKAFFETHFNEDFKAKWSPTHEFGHLLNLCDVIQGDNLMQDNKILFNVDYKLKNLPTNLTEEQVKTSRDWAYKVYCKNNFCLQKH